MGSAKDFCAREMSGLWEGRRNMNLREEKNAQDKLDPVAEPESSEKGAK